MNNVDYEVEDDGKNLLQEEATTLPTLENNVEQEELEPEPVQPVTEPELNFIDPEEEEDLDQDFEEAEYEPEPRPKRNLTITISRDVINQQQKPVSTRGMSAETPDRNLRSELFCEITFSFNYFISI